MDNPKGDFTMNHELYEEAIHSDVLSEKLISQLLESMEYSSISFINWSSGEIYTKKSFHAFVKEHFSSYIESQVFADPAKAEKIYFSLEPCKDGEYNLVMAESSKKKVYEWISSLNERFSLVEMISTGIVYIKDIRSNTYQPFISKNGKYCHYNKETGHIVEV